MISYGDPPSNQSELNLGSKGSDLMQKAREWVHDNPDAFERYKRLGRHYASTAKDGRAGALIVREMTRTGHDVVNGTLVRHGKLCISINNAISPSLARIAMEQDEGLRFRLAKSSADGFTDAVL